jgi:hypothetical protein
VTADVNPAFRVTRLRPWGGAQSGKDDCGEDGDASFHFRNFSNACFDAPARNLFTASRTPRSNSGEHRMTPALPAFEGGDFDARE